MLRRIGCFTHFLSATTIALQRRYDSPSPYRPKGMARSAMGLPLDHPFVVDSCNKLAKSAHSARNFGDAISLYDRVLAYRRNEHGLIHRDCAATLHNIGRVLIEMRDYAGAENALSEACAIYEKLEGPKSLKYADSLALLAVAYRDLKYLDESEKAFKESILIFKENIFDLRSNSWIPGDRAAVEGPPNEHPLSSVAHVLSDCSVLLINKNMEERAVAMLEESLEIRRFLYKDYVKFKPIIAQTLAKLAEVKRALGHIVQAEMHANECIDICIETMGRESPATAAAISTRGNIHSVKQEYRFAKKCYEEAATTYAIAYGKQSPLVASEFIHLGRMHEMLEEYKEAEDRFIRAAEIIRASLGSDHPQLAEANMFLAALVMKKADFDRAIPLLRDAIRIRQKLSANDPQLVFCYHKLGDALAAKRDPEAEAHFLHAIEIHKQNHEKFKQATQRLLMTDVMDDLGLHYLQFHLHDKAERMLKESLDIRLQELGEKHPTVGYSYSNMAVMYLDQRMFEACETACRASVAIYESLTKDSSFLALGDVRLTLGRCLHMQGKYYDALQILQRCLNDRRTQGERTHIQCAETLHEIAKVQLRLGETGEALKNLDEAVQLAEKYRGLTAELLAEIERTKRSFPGLTSS